MNDAAYLLFTKQTLDPERIMMVALQGLVSKDIEVGS